MRSGVGFPQQEQPLQVAVGRFSLFSFLIGIIASQKLVFFGEFYIGEVIGAFYFIFQVWGYRLDKTERRLILLATICCLAQSASDFYNKTPIVTALKGILAPGVFMTTLLAASIYFKANQRRIPGFLMGEALGSVINLYLFPHFFDAVSSTFFADNPWKWGLGACAYTVFAIWFSFYSKRRSTGLLLFFLVALAVPSLAYQARSLAFFPLIAAALYVTLRSRLGPSLQAAMLGKWGGLKFTLASVILIISINQITTYLFTAESFLRRFNDDDANKYRIQAGGTYGILLGGRSEVLVSIKAFLDKPLLGHGSWAEDKTGEYTLDYINKMIALNYTPSTEVTLTNGVDLIPTHSFLFGALVWGGIFAGLLWIYILVLLWTSFLYHASTFPFYFLNGLLGMVWNILFSPFGAVTRWESGLFLAAFFVYCRSNHLVVSFDTFSPQRKRRLLATSARASV